MRRIIQSLVVTIALVAAPGCGPEGRYCSNCESGVAQTDADGRARLIRGRCKVSGREIDCAREHAFCPECRKQGSVRE
jgi:hypothetical protein